MSARFKHRHALLGLLAALVARCDAPGAEVSLCEATGAVLGTDLYVNIVGFVRVYGSDPYEGRANFSLLDASGRTVYSGATRTYELIESGGSYVCIFTVTRTGESNQRRLGIGPIPTAMLGTLRTLQVRLVLTDRAGEAQTVTLPIRNVREVDESPTFNCATTRCGR